MTMYFSSDMKFSSDSFKDFVTHHFDCIEIHDRKIFSEVILEASSETSNKTQREKTLSAAQPALGSSTFSHEADAK